MGPINLIPESRQLARQRRVRCRAWIAWALGYSAIVLVACLVFTGLGSHEDPAVIGEDLAVLEAELSQVQQEQSQLKPQLAEQRLILASGRSITDQPDWSMLLSYIADKLLGDTVILSGCSLGPAPGSERADGPPDSGVRVTLSGYAKTTPAVSQFVLRLEGSGLFDRVTLTRTNREPFMNGQAIAFEAHCLIKREGGDHRE